MHHHPVFPDQRRAFTVLELLVSVMIVAILAALLVSGLGFIGSKQKQVVCMAHMRQLAATILMYSADHQSRLLPAVTGATAAMNSTPWYYILDTEGILPGNPKNPDNKGKALWGGERNSIMACPSRPDAPHPVWVGGKHDLHYCLNQNPGFFNRVNTSAGPWPTLASVKAPGRTFLLAEASNYLGYPDGKYFVYPHPHSGSDIQNGGGMNVVFFDGHGEYFKGRFPTLPGLNEASVRYGQITPEESFPFF